MKEYLYKKNMINILLDNSDNDKTMEIKLPIVPRIGDWIRLDHEDEFTGGEDLLTVTHVILDPNSEQIKVVVSGQAP